MLELPGDLWTIEADARCVTTNGVVRPSGALVMGAGNARQAIQRYPGIDKRLGRLVRAYGNRPYYLADLGIISFPTKHDWHNDSDLELIQISALHLVELADEHKLARVALPRPGCGLGGLEWADVRPVLAVILDDRFLVVHKDGPAGSQPAPARPHEESAPKHLRK